MEDDKKTQPIETEKPKDDSFVALHMSSRKPSKKRVTDWAKTEPGNKVVKGMFWLLVLLVVSFGGGWFGSFVENHSGSVNTSQAKEIVTSQNQLTAAIASDVSPSVVSIDSTQTTQSTSLFGASQPQQEEDAGTGIILTSSGYIVTNRHVVPAGSTSISVTLADGTTINNVTLVGDTSSDDPLDIAFLKINNPPETLTPALLGDSSKVQIGDSVVAIGNALGQFQNTVTSGIISGRGRTVQAGDSTGASQEDLQDLFQTDAAINEGNSGGPLVNINGQVIGINTAVASNGAQNIGFSIPINDVEGLIKGVLKTGKIERPYLGVYYLTLNSSVAKQNNLTQTTGAYIPPNQNGQQSIVSGSPAQAAGLQVGDIITAVNGTTISQNNSLSSLIDVNTVGTKLNLTVIRNGGTRQISVTVGAEPSGQ